MRVLKAVAVVMLVCGLFWSAGAQDNGMMRGMNHPMRGAAGPQRGMMQGGGGMDRIGGMGMMRSWRGPNFLLRNREELGLNDQQVDKIKEIRLNQVTRVSDLQSQLRVAELKLHDLLDSDQVDLAKAESQIKAVGDLKSNVMVARIKARVEATKVLTAEQRDKAVKLGRGPRSKRPGRAGGGMMMGPGMGSGQGGGGGMMMGPGTGGGTGPGN